MQKPLRNYAFIDSQNVNLEVQRLGWKLDWKRLRTYLKEKYAVDTAYLFIGFVPTNQSLYRSLQKAGFVLIFKEVTWKEDGKPKGNVDAELVLQAMIDFNEYERAIIVTSDGDFACLVRHLDEHQKLELVLSPRRKTCSALLKKAAKGRIAFLEELRARLAYVPQK
jgi:uncharacterized LabA/DUF88 family protein